MALSQWTPQHHRDLTLGRFDGYTSPKMFADVNFLSKLNFHDVTECVTLAVYSVPAGQPFPTYQEAVKAAYVPCHVGSTFGPSWSTHWFRVNIRVPDEWKNDPADWNAPLWLVWDSGSEAMVWLNGQPVQGLTDARNEFQLSPPGEWHAGMEFNLYIEMAACRVGGNGDGILPPDPNLAFTIKTANLVVPDPVAWKLLYDFLVIADLAKTLPADSAAGAEALYVGNQMINKYVRGERSSWPGVSALAEKFLGHGHAGTRHKIHAIGHCHIDTAWLWPFSETHRKVARSWASQLVLMEAHEKFTFAASSALQYKWLKEDYPDLFARVVEAVHTHRFAPVGGTWVEMDCNMPSGESLVRQFLHGTAFFKKEFGTRSQVFWLPDTFGYPAQLPAIMRGCGYPYFLTQKLSWNNINPFPHSTFYWRALDGSRVLAHFPPADTYACQATVAELVKTVSNNKDKERAPVSMYLYGNGDGGGGPTREMVERLSRLADVDGLAATVEMSTPAQFFHDLEASAQDLLTWRGELYLEFHRGTYTSHAASKQNNRTCEQLLRAVELLAALAVSVEAPSPSMQQIPTTGPGTGSEVQAAPAYRYPKEDLDAIWEDVLLFQFHDVLPGSSIQAVYTYSLAKYAEIVPRLRKLRDEALQELVRASPPEGRQQGSRGQAGTADAAAEAQDEEASTSLAPVALVFNTLGWARQEVVEVPRNWLGAGMQPLQWTSDNAHALLVATAEPLSFAPLLTPSATASSADPAPFVHMGPAPAPHSPLHLQLANPFVTAIFDPAGRLVSLRDERMQRQIVAPGMLGNRLVLFEDIPLFWDAWDAEVFHLEKVTEAQLGQVEVVENGPLRVVLKGSHPLTPVSSAVMTITLTAISPRIDFTLEVEWHEARRFLKVEFPWDLTSEHASYEVQFGAVSRPTHTNTSWDWAKFEVCGQRWGDLSEPDYGVAILNDSKYGYATHDNVMRLSLLRSPKAPDATTDMGRHVLRYAVLPHEGGWQAGGVVSAAAAFNEPLLLLPASAGDHTVATPAEMPLVHVLPASPQPKYNIPLVLDTLKLSEKCADASYEGPLELIVRLYEPHGVRGAAQLKWSAALPVSSVSATNMLEEEAKELWNAEGNSDPYSCTVAFTPFQIITLCLTLKGDAGGRRPLQKRATSVTRNSSSPSSQKATSCTSSESEYVVVSPQPPLS